MRTSRQPSTREELLHTVSSWWERLRGAIDERMRPPAGGRYSARAAQRPGSATRVTGMSYGRRSSYGVQARKHQEAMPYAVAFVLIIGMLAGFLYLGLNWATGAGREAGLGPTPGPLVIATPVAVVTVAPAPTPTPQTTYVVQAGDTPAEIASRLGVSVDRLLAENGDLDPTKLQIGQVLKIPQRPAGR